jgi:hypothetical protein
MQSEITGVRPPHGGMVRYLRPGNAVCKKRQDAISVLRDQESPMLFILRTTVDWLIPM